MWQSTTLTLPNQLADSAVNSALASALNAAQLPADQATANSNAASAASDTRRELLPSGQVDYVTVSPWSDGELSRNRHSVFSYLSPRDASEALSKLIPASWQSAVLVVAMADDIGTFSQALNQLYLSIPTTDIRKAVRRAEALNLHDQQKRFIADLKTGSKQQELAAMPVYEPLQSSAQNISISEALASDDSPAGLLADFIHRRNQRLSDIRDQLMDITSAGGAIMHSLKLNGGNIAEQLLAADPPNPQAPFTLMIAIGGTAENMQPLLETIA